MLVGCLLNGFFIISCVSILPGTHGSQKRASGSPELGKQVVVRCHAGAGNCTSVLCNGKCSYLLSQLPSSLCAILCCNVSYLLNLRVTWPNSLLSPEGSDQSSDAQASVGSHRL